MISLASAIEAFRKTYTKEWIAQTEKKHIVNCFTYIIIMCRHVELGERWTSKDSMGKGQLFSPIRQENTCVLGYSGQSIDCFQAKNGHGGQPRVNRLSLLGIEDNYSEGPLSLLIDGVDSHYKSLFSGFLKWAPHVKTARFRVTEANLDSIAYYVNGEKKQRVIRPGKLANFGSWIAGKTCPGGRTLEQWARFFTLLDRKQCSQDKLAKACEEERKKKSARAVGQVKLTGKD